MLSEPERLMKEAKDTEILIADAMAVVDKKMIDCLENLRFIQSEGVGYQGVDLEKMQ
ncbi:MAG: hypothetical protein LUG95_00245 [Clostridiales bacterium]|nr:hypothetical protein [Clostridiales bacterium]